jgi:hypothetical protein
MNKNIAAKKKKGYTVPFQTSLPDSSDSENDDVLDEGGQADAEASVPASPASPIKNKKDNKKRSLESVDAEVDDDDENINNVDAEVDDDAADDDDDDDEVAQPKKKKSKKSKPQKPPLTKKQLARKKAADAFEYTGGRSGMELQNEDRTRYYKCKVNKSKFEVTLKYGALSKDGEEGKAQVTTKQCDNVKEAMKYCSTKMKKQLKNGIVLLQSLISNIICTQCTLPLYTDSLFFLFFFLLFLFLFLFLSLDLLFAYSSIINIRFFRSGISEASASLYRMCTIIKLNLLYFIISSFVNFFSCFSLLKRS